MVLLGPCRITTSYCVSVGPKPALSEATQRLAEADRLAQQIGEDQPCSPAHPWYFLAMAHHGLGHREEANKWLDKAVSWTDKVLREADLGTADHTWNRRQTLMLLRDEVEALLKSTPASASPLPKPAVKEKEKPK
jgi:hypothetical protein